MLEPTYTSWTDVDPARHPFMWDDAEQVRVTAMITARAGGGPTAVMLGTGAKHPDLFVWVTELFTERYGSWTAGWEWTVHDAGPVNCWCCPPGSSVEDSPEGIAGWSVACLLQFRAWLEHLAEDFQNLAPPSGSSQDIRSRHIERAVARLVTTVMSRTGCEDAWYALVVTTLGWYFEACGFTPQDARAAAETAQGGPFRSWIGPSGQEVRDYARSLAAEVTGATPYSER